MKIKKGFQTVPGESIIQNAYPEGSVMFPDISKSYRVVAQTDCPVCGSKADVFEDNQKYDGLRLECPKCKRFEITRTLMQTGSFLNLSMVEKEEISKFIAEYYSEFNSPFELHTANYKVIASFPSDWDFVKDARDKYANERKEYNSYLWDLSRNLEYIKLPSIILQNYRNLISVVEQSQKGDVRRTEQNLVRIMQSIAQKISPQGPFCDFVVGYGGLLDGLQNVAAIQDMNPDYISVAKVLVNQNNKKVSATVGNSIFEKTINDGHGIFLFDPPFGAKMFFEQNDESEKITEIIGYQSDLKYTELSEYLFLASFLAGARDDAYFIALMPESFLSKQSLPAKNLREYLLRNSLIGVIKPAKSQGINKVILVGQKKRNSQDYKSGFSASLKIDLTQDKLDAFVNFCLNVTNQDYDSDNIKDFEDFSLKQLSLIKGNIIDVPIVVKILDKPKKSATDLIKYVASNEDDLDLYKNKILSEDFLKHSVLPSVVDVAKDETPWFLLNNYGENFAFDETGKALRFLHQNKQITISNQEECVLTNIKFKDKNDVGRVMQNVYFLYVNNRISKKSNCLEIDWKLKKEDGELVNISHQTYLNFREYMHNIMYTEDVTKILDRFPKIIKNVYNDLLDFWFLRFDSEDIETSGSSKEELTLMFKQNETKDIILALKVLRELGFVYKINVPEEFINQKISIYYENAPNHPFLMEERDV